MRLAFLLLLAAALFAPSDAHAQAAGQTRICQNVTTSVISGGVPIVQCQDVTWGLAQGGTTAGATGSLILCRTLVAAPSDVTATANVPRCDLAGDMYVTVSGVDPCQSSSVVKTSVPINITSATTTSLVAVSGTTTVYVCGFTVTVSEVITTANTIAFEYGTGATCTGPVLLTGTFGSGGVTAGAPVPITYGGAGQTIFKGIASNGLCALTAIGASGSFQGVLTYVQQ